jgi:hypothetical protein
MSDTPAFDFGKFVPGFDFLQNLARTASARQAPGAGIPGMSNWVAPTLSVEEIDKRIQELKAVQFWLEQNSTALKATIQALEVQKMTLTTLQGMNVNMAELAKAFSARMPEAAQASAASASTSVPEPAAEAPAEPATAKAARPRAKAKPQAAPAGGVDPLAWWGSLTQQFQNIAASAMKDVAADAMKAQDAVQAAEAAAGQPATKGSARKRPARKAASTARKAAAGKKRPAA